MNRRKLLLSLAGCAACRSAAGWLTPDNMAEGRIFRKDAPKKIWKWSKEAYHYERKGEKTVCLVCPNHCELSPGDRSACRVKVNIDGTVHTLAYGNPCAVNVDPVEKKPLFHFLPGTAAFSLATAGCNIRCLNCQNWEISQSRPEDTRNRELFPDAVTDAALHYGCASIAYTYSEPTAWYEYLFDTAQIARTRGIRNVWITNGYMSRTALEPLCRILDAANVDLKAFSEETYTALNGCHLKPVLETLKILKEHGVWIEITTLLVPGYTDDPETPKGIADWVLKTLGPEVPLHFSRFQPQHKLSHLSPTAADRLAAARDTALRLGLRHVYTGNVPELGPENTTCPSCGKIVIRRTGFTVKSLNVDKRGRCDFCGGKIAGRFA